MAKQQRGNAYLLVRLQNEHPALYADLQAGKFKSAREAFITAGLKQQPKPLNVLKNAWAKASASEKAEFRSLVCISGTAASSVGLITCVPATGTQKPPTVVIAVSSSQSAINSAGYILPWAQTQTRSIMYARKMKMGDVMAEMGYKKLNPALGLALNGSYRIQPRMAEALEKWLDDNKAAK